MRHVVAFERHGLGRVVDADTHEAAVADAARAEDGSTWPVGPHAAYVSDGCVIRRMELRVSDVEPRFEAVPDSGPVTTRAASIILAAFREEREQHQDESTNT